VRFEDFEQRATQLWQEIPGTYRAGVDGLRVERGARAHPSLADVYTMGECLTETYPSDFGGPDTTRSLVVLYYGSFWRLSRLDPEFDWEGELWETLTHELRHHLESLAADDELEEQDYAADENFKRLEGSAFDPFFFRAGERVEGGWYRVEDEYFREYEGKSSPLEFEWERARYRVQVPDAEADVLFLNVDLPVPPPSAALCLVQSRPQGTWRLLRSLFAGEQRVVREYDVVAERTDD
jgi:hypothetical protein